MELALTFSDADAVRIEKYAAERDMSVFDYAKKILRKGLDEEDARAKANAEDAVKIEESRKQFAEGRFVTKTWEELTELVHE